MGYTAEDTSDQELLQLLLFRLPPADPSLPSPVRPEGTGFSLHPLEYKSLPTHLGMPGGSLGQSCALLVSPVSAAPKCSGSVVCSLAAARAAPC